MQTGTVITALKWCLHSLCRESLPLLHYCFKQVTAFMFQFMLIAFYPPTVHHCNDALRCTCLHLLNDFLGWIGKLLWGVSSVFVSAGLKKPLSLSPSQRTIFQPPNTECTSIHFSLLMSILHQGSKIRHRRLKMKSHKGWTDRILLFMCWLWPCLQSPGCCWLSLLYMKLQRC